MSRFVERHVERVDLGDGDWVHLRARLSYGDRAAIEEKLFSVQSTISGEMSLPNGLQMRLANLELLLHTVVAWGGPGFCQKEHPHEGACVPRPINVENLDLLDETAERILAELQERIVRRTPDFTPPPSPTTSTAVGAEAPGID